MGSLDAGVPEQVIPPKTTIARSAGKRERENFPIVRYLGTALRWIAGIGCGDGNPKTGRVACGQNDKPVTGHEQASSN